MAKYIISITARDRAGIVAGISEALLEKKGNIEAASQTVHQGYFAMIILCSFRQEISKVQLAQCINVCCGNGMHVFVTDYEIPEGFVVSQGQLFIVTARGPDKPGILHALTSYLASKNINIDDLYARVEEGEFIVICQATIPSGMDVYMLQMDLESVGESMGLVVHMQHENVFVATNELRFGRSW